jgi:hypothetical protein
VKRDKKYTGIPGLLRKFPAGKINFIFLQKKEC